MATVSNAIIDLNNFKEEDVKLSDIATVLSHINRYNGHTSETYSVLEHSLLVGVIFTDNFMDKFSFDNIMACFLHDAAEVYIGDIISPMKVRDEFEFFRKMDDEISGIIYKAFGIDVSKIDWDTVKLCDKQACYIEMSWFFKDIPVNFVQSCFDVDLNDYPKYSFANSTDDFIESINLVYKKFKKEIPEILL
jgi:hypothetical protein